MLFISVSMYIFQRHLIIFIKVIEYKNYLIAYYFYHTNLMLKLVV